MKCIVFDIDGTLFDTKEGIIKTLNEVLNKYGIGKIPKQNEDKYIGPPVKESFIKFHGFDEIKVEEATNMYRDIYINENIGLSVPYDGLYEILNYINKNNYISCIATMKTENQVKKLLSIFKLESEFEIIKCASLDGGVRKKDMLSEIRNSFDLSENVEFIMVGDTKGDYDAAEAAGYRFVAANYGYGDFSELNVLKISELSKLKLFI